MIRGIHAMLYTSEAEAARAFLRDKLGLACFDAGEGWLICDLPMAEVGCHPTMPDTPAGRHEMSFICDDVEAEVAALKEKGVEFAGPIEDRGWGLATEMNVPGGVKVTLYQPRYKRP